MYLRQQHYSRCHLLVRLGQRIAWSHPFPVSCGDRGIITSQPVPFCSSVSLCSAYCKGVGVCARNTPCPQSASLVVPARCRCSGRVRGQASPGGETQSLPNILSHVTIHRDHATKKSQAFPGPAPFGNLLKDFFSRMSARLSIRSRSNSHRICVLDARAQNV